jgi:hypothetical protein
MLVSRIGRPRTAPAMTEGERNRSSAPRTFRPPWSTVEIPGGFRVEDANRRPLASIYSGDSEAEALQAKVLTKDEARRIAVNFARLPDLPGKTDRD